MEDLKNVVTLIQAACPDVACLQEVYSRKKGNVKGFEYLQKNLGYKHSAYAIGTTCNENHNPHRQEMGNAIFSKFPITKTTERRSEQLLHNPPDEMTESRVYLEADLDVGETEPLKVGNTHLSYSKEFEIFDWRMEKFQKLWDMIIKEKDRRFVFGGDMNALPNSRIIQIILESLKNAGPDFNVSTWPTKPFEHEGFSADPPPSRHLDYSFCTSDIEVLKSSIINTRFSDHLPIISYLKI